MNYKEVKQIVINVICDKLGWDVDDFELDSKFINDLGVDSLDEVELIVEFEQKFNISIPDEEAESLPNGYTVKDVVDFLCKKLNISIENKMKVKCINVRNFRNLTLNQEYEVVEQSVDFYHVVNNNGSTARYSKEYFEVVEDQLINAAVEVEPIAELPIEDEVGVVENDITFEFDSEGVFSLINIFLNDEKKMRLQCIDVAGNCGTWSISGINSVRESFGEELFVEVMDKLMEFLTDETSKGCIVFSTNLNDNEDVVEWLDKHSTGKVGEFFNPNSDNQVDMWWFLINQDIEGDEGDNEPW